jgi:hypothetical protein
VLRKIECEINGEIWVDDDRSGLIGSQFCEGCEDL